MACIQSDLKLHLPIEKAPSFCVSSQKTTIHALPPEILLMIFSFLPALGKLLEKHWNAAALVCKQWNVLFDDVHPLKLLKYARFRESLLTCPISSYAENSQQVTQITTRLENWMDDMIKTCQTHSANQAHFIWENMWLTSFNPSLSCPNENIESQLSTLRRLDVTTYRPEHLSMVLGNLTDIPVNALIEALRLKYIFFSNIPEKLRKPNLYLWAIEHIHLRLSSVPADKRTYEICMAATEQDARDIAFIPQNEDTHKIYLDIVQRCGFDLQYIPEEKTTEDINLAAVQQNGLALKCVLEAQRTKKICLAAIQENPRAIYSIPDEHRKDEIGLAVVQRDGYLLQAIPENQRTYPICLAAVKADGRALEFVPPDQWTDEIFLEAVKADVCALEFVPRARRTYPMCLAAVKRDGRVLRFVPKIHRTNELWLAAFSKKTE